MASSGCLKKCGSWLVSLPAADPFGHADLQPGLQDREYLGYYRRATHALPLLQPDWNDVVAGSLIATPLAEEPVVLGLKAFQILLGLSPGKVMGDSMGFRQLEFRARLRQVGPEFVDKFTGGLWVLSPPLLGNKDLRPHPGVFAVLEGDQRS